MQKERLLQYTDAIIAIIITIMVLEFKVPHSTELSVLFEMKYIFWAYLLSFIFLSIYWNNHHHLFQVIEKINGSTLWINNIFIFFLTLIPFVTAWMSENHFHSNTVIAYGIIFMGSALSYAALMKNLIQIHGKHSHFASEIGSDFKGNMSLFLYIIWILSAFWYAPIGLFFFTLIAIMWLIPDRRMEKIHSKK